MIDKDNLVDELVEAATDSDSEVQVIEIDGKPHHPVLSTEEMKEDLPNEMPEQEREAARDFEDWGWEPEDMVVTQTEPTTGEAVDEEYADVVDDEKLPKPENEQGSDGRPGTGTRSRKRDLTVSEFASLAEDRGERGWTKEEWQEWWNQATKEKQALEINDFYRVWVKSPEDAPPDVELHSADELKAPAPADNTHFYEVPFTVSTGLVPIDEAEKALSKRSERPEFPTKQDILFANLPDTDLTVAEAVTTGEVRKMTPSTITQVKSPLTLLYGVKMASSHDGVTWRNAEKLFKRELEDRGVVSISRHCRPVLRENPDQISKYKVYVDDAEDVPEEYQVQTGPQGGLYYEVSSNEEEEEAEEVESNISGNEIEFGGFGVDRFESEDTYDDIVDHNVEHGDKLYVEHPNDPNYIAEVDSVSVDADQNWEISFGGGSYTLREDTSSTPVGMVTEEPSLGQHEEVNHIDDVTDNVETGDVVTYEDPAGYEHYVQVEGWTPDGDIVTPDEEVIRRGEVEGVVETTNPTAKYDIPDRETIEQGTNLGEDRIEAAISFNEELSKAVADGDATQLPSYNYRDFAGSIFDEDLAIATYKSIIDNDGTQTQRRRMEQRMRSLGLNPEEHKPREVPYNPDDVPQTRQGTMYSAFDGEKTRNAIADAVQNGRISDNYAAWNDFFDHVTQGEIEEALRTAVSNSVRGKTWNGDPMDYEDGDDVDIEENPASEMDIRNNDQLSACWSRLEGDTDELVETAQEIIDNAPSGTKDYVAVSSMTWISDPEARRELFEDYFDGHLANVPSSHTPRMQMQFADDHATRGSRLIDRYTSSTSSEDTKFARAVARSFDFNSEASAFNKGVATEPVEPTEELEETFETLREETAEYIEEHHDGKVTLYRGVDNSVTANASLESWTDSVGTADSKMFDNHAVLEATFKPGEILATHQINQHDGWGYSGYNENEWTVFGGPIAEEVGEDQTVEEVFGDVEEMDIDPMHPEFTGT